MYCKICGKATEVLFKKEILTKYSVQYFQCPNCKFIQTEHPFWLNEAYKNSINVEDTGLVERNLLFAKRSSMVLFYLFNAKNKFLDYGGGYGLFVRLMRDYGFDFFWNDPYTENIFSKGYEYELKNKKQFEAVTTFECFEHFEHPLPEIEKLLELTDTILFSTEIFSHEAPHPELWAYYYFSHGQHISLYSLESLKMVAQKYNLHLCTNGKSFHMLSRKKKNNAVFNLLLKASLFGFPLFVKKTLGGKTKTDSLQSQQLRIGKNN